MTAAGVKAPGVRPVRRSVSSRIPPDEFLPPETDAALRDVARALAKLPPEPVRYVDGRLGIGERHNVSLWRLRDFMERERKRAAGGEDRVSPRESSGRAWTGKHRAHRERQASVARIIEEMFGPLADNDPGLWEHRAYLMLVGLVYERLSTNENELATDELVSLARALAEHRRISSRAGTGDPKDDPEAPAEGPDGRLPDHFADVVRQVYGTNFQKPT